MTGMNEFIEVFGGLTVANLVKIVLIAIFLRFIYIKVKQYFENRIKTEKENEEKLEKCLNAIGKYPEYREQSIKMQKNLQGQIDEMRKIQGEVVNGLKELRATMEKRERNKLRDKLLQYYRFYTNPEKNPTQSWTTMEANAFWELFKDYEELNGDGYMHTEVQPAMNRLIVVEVNSDKV